MRGENQPAAIVDDVTDRWHGRLDARIVGDLAVVVEGDVEVDAAEHPFAFEVDVTD
jgi:hypothetical protein